MFDLKGKVAMITGASSGLGWHFAKVLAAHGAKVVAAARRKELVDKLAQEIRRDGGEAIGVAVDVTDPAQIVGALDAAEAAFGTVTVLVNNAGLSVVRRFSEVDEDSWDNVMEVNLKAVWRVSSEVSRRMIETETGGAIVNVASVYGLRPVRGQTTYCVSKAAVVQMTGVMALDLIRYGIRTNALCPGFFVSELTEEFLSGDAGEAFIKLTPARRIGELSELDAPLLLLTSDAGSFVNGVALPVDGGAALGAL